MCAHVLAGAVDYECGVSIASGYCDEICADTEYVLSFQSVFFLDYRLHVFGTRS